MDDKTLSDFMPKVNSEGDISFGDVSTSESVNLTNDMIIEVLTKIKDPEPTAADMDAAVRTLSGSARSAGIEVEG